jgi:hypothetical protein
MYPSGELTRLAQRKSVIQARIAVRRWETAAAVLDVARPIAYIDRAIELWRRVSPFLKFLAVPAGIMVTRMLTRRKRPHAPRRKGKIAMLLTVLPLIFRGLKMAKALQTAYAAGRASSKTPRTAKASMPAANPSL